PMHVAQLEARCAAFPGELADWTAACRRVLGGLVVLATVPLSPLRRDRYVDYATRARVEAAWSRMNAGILDLGADAGTVVLSTDAIATRLGGPVFAPDRMRHVAG